MQSLFINITKPAAAINKRIHPAIQKTLIFLCMLGMMIPIMGKYVHKDRMISYNTSISDFFTSLLDLGDGGRGVTAVILMTLIVLFSVRKPLKKIEFNWYISLFWFVGSILIIIAGIFHDIGSGFLIVQIAVLLLFPALYIAWNENLKELYDLIALAALAFILIECILLLHYPFDSVSGISGKYRGPYIDSNVISYTFVAGLCPGLYLISRDSKLKRLFASVMLGLILCVILISFSRGAYLTAGVVVLCWFILYFKKSGKLLSLILSVVIAAVSFFGYYMTVSGGNDPLNIRSVTAAGQTVYADETVSEPDSPSSTDILGRLENFNNLNQYTTGRVGIWKVFSKYINWTGNDVTYTLPVRVLHYTGQSARYYTTTHNNAYDIVIRAGLPAGIIYLLMQLIALVYSLKKIFGRRKNVKAYDLFVVPAFMIFIVEGNMETYSHIFSSLPTLLYFLSLTVLLGFGVKTNNREEVSVDAQ